MPAPGGDAKEIDDVDNIELGELFEYLENLHTEKVDIPELPKSAARELPPGVIRYRLLFAVVAFAVIIFLGEAIECWKYCKDVHDVRELYDPFQSAAIALLGSAVAYYFAERNNRNA